MKQTPFLTLLLGMFFLSSCLWTNNSLLAQKDLIIAEQNIIRLLDSVAIADDFLTQYVFLDSAKQICQEIFGKKHGLYAECLNEEGKVHYYQGDFSKTDSLWQRVADIRADFYGEEHTKYLDALTNKLIILPYVEKYKEAEPYIVKIRRVLEKDSLYFSISGADAIETIGNIYEKQGKLDSAKMVYREVLSIRKLIYGENDPALGNSYVNIGNIELDKYNYEKSRLELEKAEAIWRNSESVSPRNKRTLYTDLGDLYKQIGKFDLAKQSFEKALELTEEVFSEKHLYYGASQMNLAQVFLSASQFEEAEVHLMKAFGVFKNNSVGSNSNLIKCYHSLIQLYIQLNQQGKAAELLEEVIGYIDKENSSLREDYITYLLIKGSFEIKFNPQNAIPPLLEAIEFAAKGLYENESSKELHLSHNLATAYTKMGEFNKADSIYTSLLVKWLAFSDENSIDLWQANGALGLSKINLEQFDSAAIYFQRARNIADTMGYFRHLEHHQFMEAALRLEMDWKKNVFDDTREELFVAYRYQLNKGLAHLSVKEQNDIIEGSLSTTSSLIHSNTASNGELSFNIGLLDKGRVLQSKQQMNRFIQDAQDSILFDHYNELSGVRRRLSSEYLKPTAEQVNLIQLKVQEEELERELSRSSSSFRRQQRANSINHQNVYSYLPENAAVIEFVHFNNYNPDLTDSVIYAATIMRQGDTSVHFIPLFEQEELVQLLDAEAINDQAYLANKIYRTSDPIDQKNIPASEELYELIWPEIEKNVAGVKNIYFSPSGLLHRINLGALVPKEGMHLRDVYNFQQMSSTRELVLQKEEPRIYQNHTALIMGGIDYDEQQFTPTNSTASNASLGIGFQYAKNRSVETAFTKLPATSKEASLITSKLEQADYQVRHLSDKNATETAVKEVGRNGNSPRVLHIATHGFYFPNPDSTQTAGGFRLANHPMVRSGLALAGSNEAWLGNPPKTGEDGILTAYEISQLNLSQTELVVLSACETGLGDIHGSEGVFGLQRAFKMAGAQYLLLSLWKVDDNATQGLMTIFYEYYLQGQLSIPEAFNEAQSKLQAKYPNNPAMWAGFVLVQ